MDGISWSTARAPESFSRSRTTSDTLSRLANFIARAETKQPARNQGEDTPHLAMYACPECGKGFTYVTDMRNHQEVEHALPKPHRCPSCGLTFSLRSSLQLHQCDGHSVPCELCHGEIQLGSPCPECRTLDSLRDKSLHRQPYVLCSSLYACAPCGRGFSQKQALLQHQQAGCTELPSCSVEADARSLPDNSAPPSEGDSSRSDSSDAPGPSSRGVSVSHYCSRSLHNEDGPQRHQQAEAEGTRGQRTKGERTDGDTRKARDVNVNREPKTKQKSKKKLLSCRSCAMVFRSTTRLSRHRQQKHSRENSTACEPWPVGTFRKQSRHPCPICGKVLFHHMSLRAHLRQHIDQSVGCNAKDQEISERRPNEAKSSLTDGKTAKADPGRPSEVSTLEAEVSDQGRDEDEAEEEEEEEEEEEMEFPCPSCAEVFSLQWQLRDHVELHQSSVKRTQCSVCTHGMDTCKLPGSKRHRPYHCVPCQQSFSAMGSFLEHCQEHLRARVEEDCLMEGYAQQTLNVATV